MFRTAVVATTALVMSAVAGADTSFPITFDEATPPSVTPFGGASYSIEVGPAGGDGNALKIVRDGGDDFAGAYVAVSGIPNDAGPQTLSARVYSPMAGIPMVTKLEFDNNAGTGEVQSNEMVSEGWQRLSWTYSNLAPPNDYNRFVILPNLGTVDTATSYYFDNIDLVVAAFSADGAVESKSGGFKFPDGTVQMTAQFTGPPRYEIGDRGPAGGLVFHVTADGLHGLEAAPEDQSTGAAWGCAGTDIPGAESQALGAGARNTDDITPYGCTSSGIAATLAAEYVSTSDYYDWFLPSTTEAGFMVSRLGPSGTGDIPCEPYWSSTEFSAHNALQRTCNGAASESKSNNHRVRAVREF